MYMRQPIVVAHFRPGWRHRLHRRGFHLFCRVRRAPALNLVSLKNGDIIDVTNQDTPYRLVHY